MTFAAGELLTAKSTTYHKNGSVRAGELVMCLFSMRTSVFELSCMTTEGRAENVRFYDVNAMTSCLSSLT